MTTKTDNYRETAEQLRSEDKLCEPEGDCPHCCELRLKMRGADAIDALINERDALREEIVVLRAEIELAKKEIDFRMD